MGDQQSQELPNGGASQPHNSPVRAGGAGVPWHRGLTRHQADEMLTLYKKGAIDLDHKTVTLCLYITGDIQ